ncbi:hypothetical protein pb186bvf_011067 [Paramecium bursaria]
MRTLLILDLQISLQGIKGSIYEEYVIQTFNKLLYKIVIIVTEI